MLVQKALTKLTIILFLAVRHDFLRNASMIVRQKSEVSCSLSEVSDNLCLEITFHQTDCNTLSEEKTLANKRVCLHLPFCTVF